MRRKVREMLSYRMVSDDSWVRETARKLFKQDVDAQNERESHWTFTRLQRTILKEAIWPGMHAWTRPRVDVHGSFVHIFAPHTRYVVNETPYYVGPLCDYWKTMLR